MKSRFLPKEKRRGAFDFECWDWVNPRACGLKWGPPDAREHEIYIDEPSENPKSIAKNALWLMATMPGNVKEWWGHNAGKYDDLFIIEALHELRWRFSAHIAGGAIVTLKINGPHGTFKIHDSFRVVQSALGHAAKDFELKSAKLFTKEDYSKDVRDWKVDRLKDGCLLDCELVLQLLEKVETFFEQEGGQLKATFSSSALSVVKAHAKVLDMRALSVINTIARKSFCGGRVEVYRHTPKYLLKEWDINSSYPWAMSQNLPYQFLGHINASKAEHALYEGKGCGVVEATVSVPETYLPVLPWRHPDHGGIYFPTGEWRGWFDSEELLYAIQQGTRLLAVHSMLHFSSEAPFKDFATNFYKRKSESKGAARQFYKLCLNGCYGKFSQKPEKEEITVYENQEAAIAAAFEPRHENRFRFLGNDLRYVAIESERWPAQTHYALAAAITARSRVKLHSYLLASEQVAYTDTDSIHASVRTRSLSASENNDLGGLKVELDGYSAVYAAPKIYALHPEQAQNRKTDEQSVYKSKGFEVSAESFQKILAGETVEAHRMQLAKRQLASYHPTRHTETGVRRKLDGRSWKGLSTKRTPLYDSNGDTRAWSVKELLADKHLTSISPLAKWLYKKS